MKYKIIFLLVISFILFSCEDYVQDLPPREGIIEDKVMVDSTDIGFLVTGIQANFSSTLERIIMTADILGDQFKYAKDITKDATFETFEQLESGDLRLDNNTVDGLADNLGELWFLSNDLITRVENRMGTMSDNLKNYALYNSYLYNGVAHELYAGYFGLTKTQGGGCIDAGPFIESNDMYDLAIEKYTEALKYATADEAKVARSLIARCYLYKGDYSNAKSNADAGLVNGDAGLIAAYSPLADNYVWQQGCINLRCQVIVPDRFADYIAADANEANRVLLIKLPLTLYAPGADTSVTYWTQGKYDSDASPIPFMTWQENNLMLAELAALHGQSGDAVTLVNEVRTSYGIADVATVDQTVIIEERDKELFLTGNRLIDLRRFNIWHLAADKWMYLPITEKERNSNDNID